MTLMAVGIYMSEYEVFGLYPIHKSVGVILFFFIIVRVVVRIKNGWPPAVSQYQVWEQVLAKLVHWVLLLATLLFPLSGMLMSGAGGHGIAVFGLELVARNSDPLNIEKVIPFNETLAELGHETHELLGTIMIVIIALHILGAFKHHVIDKAGTLRRMLGKQI
jgi:cytochrome b561